MSESAAAAAQPSFVSVSVDAMPSGLDVDIATNLVFVDGQQNGTITILDGTTGNVVLNALPLAVKPPVPLAPHGVAVDSITHTAVVANQGNDSVSIVRESGGAWSASTVDLPKNSQPHGVGVNPATQFVYLANQGNNNMSVIDVSLNPVAEIPNSPFATGSNPHGIGVDPANNLVFVANRKSATVSIFEGATRGSSGVNDPVLLATTAVGDTNDPQPTGIGVNPNLKLAYVSNNAESSVTVISYGPPNSPAKPAVNTIPNIGSGPDRFALNTDSGDMYVSDNLASQVTAISSDGLVKGSVVVGSVNNASAPTEMGYLPLTGLLYVAVQNDNEVVAVDPSFFDNIGQNKS